MKGLAAALALGALLAAPAGAVKVRRADGAADAPKTIKQVVNLLEEMMKKTKEEAKKDRDMYAKYKCYCDSNGKEKKKSVSDLTKQIGLLENQVAELQAANGGLSLECAKLKTDMDANKQAQEQATALRTAEADEFVQTEADLTAAIDQLGQAVDVLAAIGADQKPAAASAAASAASLVKLKQNVQQALVAAGSFVTPAQRKTLQAFIQTNAPFSGDFASQGGGVVGILKGMKETFETNLESAKTTEENAKKAHEAFLETKTEEWNALDASYQTKQETLGGNDGDLGTKKSSLDTARTQLDADQEFLAKLEEMCGEKSKEYDKRVELRQMEEAAISEAIAVLNSDEAFDTFNKVTATTTGATGFVQLRSVRRRVRGALLSQRVAAQRVLRDAASAAKDARMARIAGLLALGNPFNIVLEEIDKMKDLLSKEAAQDLEQKTWCEDETKSSEESLASKTKQIDTLDGDISTLDNAINHPETGLIKMIADNEKSLQENAKAQADETEAREEEHKLYKETLANCNSAVAILKRAISVLGKYYAKMEKKVAEDGALLQRQDPAPPSTWEAEGKYSGQSGSGKKVIGMLEFISTETQKEADIATADEEKAETDYEDSMTALKDEATKTGEDLASNKEELATKKEELEEKKIDLEKTKDEKRTIEGYLERIKPGCDWIKENYATRETNRATEKTALDKAVTMLKGTAAFKRAAAKEDSLKTGYCKGKCAGDEAHADCKACLAEVSVEEYCKGHSGAPGC